MNVLVLGLGLSGKSAVDFLLKRGVKVTGLDRKEIPSLQHGHFTFHKESDPINLNSYDYLVVSPGISRDHPIYVEAREKKIPIIGEAELALREIDQYCIGITGTNGKSTVTLMVAHIIDGVPLGNLGVPLTQGLESDKPYVVELSSFQLETLRTRAFDIGAILNISPDHLERYRSFEEYAQTKLHLFNCLKENSPMIMEQRCYEKYQPKGNVITYGFGQESDITPNECPLPPQYTNKKTHDVENILAAFGICRQIGISKEDFYERLYTFKKPKHRIEFARKIGGVAYYNDSKATNVDAVIRAVESFDEKIVLIAGGVDKGTSYFSWINPFHKKVRYVFAIGEAAEKIYDEIGKEVPVRICKNLREAVENSMKEAKKGENVLLSPGCSSFDMFDNYAHRGDEFKNIVKGLA